MASIKKNFVYQIAYQVVATVLPLVTSPYLSRKLGADNLGIYSYTLSIANYFMIFAMLGFVNYGTRCIAAVKNDAEERNKRFSEIYYLQLLLAGFITIIYVAGIIMMDSDNKIVAILQSLWILSCMFDVTWYYGGIENFKLITTRNFIVKILTVVSIFVFVRTPEDLWIYVLIMAGGTFISQLILMCSLIKERVFCRVAVKDIYKHWKECFVLFIPILVTSSYNILGKTILGMWCEYAESGYYYNADKLINIPLCLITSVGTIMLPRMTSLYVEQKADSSNAMIRKTIDLVTCLSSVMMFGILGVVKDFVPVFFGEEFIACISVCIILSANIYFKSLSTTIRSVYLIPRKKDGEYVKTVSIASIMNLIMNIILIPRAGAIGVAISCVIAEGIVCIYQIVIANRDVNLVEYLAKTWQYILFGIIMFVIIRRIAMLDMNIFYKLAMQISFGTISYFALCFVWWYRKKEWIWRNVESFLKRKM